MSTTLVLCLTNHQTMNSFKLGDKTTEKETIIIFCLAFHFFIAWTYRGQHIEKSQSWKVLCCLADESSYWLTLTQKSQMAFPLVYCFYSLQISVYMFKYSVFVWHMHIILCAISRSNQTCNTRQEFFWGIQNIYQSIQKPEWWSAFTKNGRWQISLSNCV